MTLFLAPVTGQHYDMLSRAVTFVLRRCNSKPNLRSLQLLVV